MNDPKYPQTVLGMASLRILFWMRNAVVLAGALVIVVATFGLGIELPLLPIAAIGLLALGANAVIFARRRRASRAGSGEIFAHLVFDVILMSALLAVSGGPMNPFVSFYVLPLVVSATLLGTRATWALAGVALSCYSLLFWLAPNSEHVAHVEHNMLHHVIGMWLAFLLLAGMIAYFVTAMGERLREQQRRLNEARESALRASQLVALGTLAASTAHELGTPLNTMVLLSDELRELVPSEGRATLDDLTRQLTRCTETLANLSLAAGGAGRDDGTPPAIDSYLSDLLTQWQSQHTGVVLHSDIDGARPAPRLPTDRALRAAIVNVLDNAAQASPARVDLRARWTSDSLRLDILDYGPGMSDEAIARAGEIPYTEKATGMGLGLFLTHRIIERLGGRVRCENVPRAGLRTAIELPLSG
jgi:two-component system sensor histidine kinase RegB